MLHRLQRQKTPTEHSPERKEVEQTKLMRISERLTSELVIALAGPIGSGCTTTYKTIEAIMRKDYCYDVSYYKLSDFIAQGAPLVDEKVKEGTTKGERIDQFQTIGDKLRKRFDANYLAAKAIEQIAELRDEIGFGETTEGVAVPKKLRRVHIIDSIKHPEELKLLRATYGEIFWLIGVFAPMHIRSDRLSHREEIDLKEIPGLVSRDYKEDDNHGQKVRDVFYQADFFIRNDQENTTQLEKSVSRFVEILFGYPTHTPTTDESLMYSAYAEGAKSACLSRQVGAAIANPNGELIGLGRNDVPKYEGGLYTENDSSSDHRCHLWQDKCCHNDKKKENLYYQIYSNLKSLLSEGSTLDQVTAALKSTDVKQLIEYSRAVHAEMDAITSIARTHKPGILGGTLYVTAFPCHSCARHIVASGITKVFFIEPYPKSLATDLHSDAVSENETDTGRKVLFLQYSGIAPKNILKLFNAGLTRKDDHGKLVRFDKKTAVPVVAVSLDDYTTHEKWVIAELEENENKASGEQQSTLFES